MSTFAPHLSLPAPQPVHGPVRPVRLTMRGKIVLVMAVSLVLGLGVLLLGSSTAASGGSGGSVPTEIVRVQPGTTLWQLAADADPRGDIRDTMAEIIRLNSLVKGAPLQAGMQIAVPVRHR